MKINNLNDIMTKCFATPKQKETKYIYNVLYKGLTPSDSWVLPFETYEKAKDFCNKKIDENENLKCISTWGRIDVGYPDDFRCQDKDGNDIWYVIFQQEIN